MTINKNKIIRIVSGILLAVLAVNAFGGGYYALSGAKGVPLEWLEGSPFKDYFIPGLFLFIVIGGMATISAILALYRHLFARPAALICGVITLSWIIVQVSIIGYVSWLQPAVAIIAVVILLLNYFK